MHAAWFLHIMNVKPVQLWREVNQTLQISRLFVFTGLLWPNSVCFGSTLPANHGEMMPFVVFAWTYGYVNQYQHLLVFFFFIPSCVSDISFQENVLFVWTVLVFGFSCWNFLSWQLSFNPNILPWSQKEKLGSASPHICETFMFLRRILTFNVIIFRS